MLPDQWLLDQNNIVHRIAVGRRSLDDYWDVETADPVPALPPLPIEYIDYDTLPFPGMVTDIWYIPRFDPDGMQFETIFVSVQAL